MNLSIHLEEIPYRPDSCDLFERIRDLPSPAFLDSSHPHSSAGRFDILTADPMDKPPLYLAHDSSPEARANFFLELKQFHKECFGSIQPVSQDIPFCGGVLGYLSYDLGNGLEGIRREGSASTGPLCGIHAYSWAVIQDHLLKRSVLVTLPGVGRTHRREIMSRLLQRSPSQAGKFSLGEDFSADISPEQYKVAFEQVQAYIKAGDCYQVNLAQHFAAPFVGDAWSAYKLLRAAAAAPFSAFLSDGRGSALLSLSPERFLTLHGRKVETSPIKGTRPRYSDPVADQLAAQDLQGASKDRAENLMIVDLLRNDLGRSCVPGSIHVDRLFEVQSFPTVHHLVSTISGELQENRSAWELLRDSFPGGSITGAPKRRAMQIISELESAARGPYCGSVFYVSADGRMDSNIAIRTLWCQDNTIHCWSGGGLVSDSQWQAEYQETYDKVGRFLSLLESLPRD
jgi:para-aminobenzoate synthetase component 1